MKVGSARRAWRSSRLRRALARPRWSANGSPPLPLPRSPRPAVTPRKFNLPFFFWLPARLAFGLNKPRNHILGNEFAGEVEAIGSAVTGFKQGDQVFGYVGQSMGAYAEYVCMPEDGAVTIKPINLTYEEAVVISYGAIMALSLLRKANSQSGPKVLIDGASGGTRVHFRATKNRSHSTASCSSLALS
jgi:hypothetical protein